MILAIDTATQWLGVGLHNGTTVLAEVGWRTHNNHTTDLSPAVKDILFKGRITVADLQAIAVTIGPGSYTGLRIGLAMAKGLALAHNLSLLGIATLDVVAAGVPRFEGTLTAVAEAGRTRVCTATYHWQSNYGWVQKEAPDIKTWSDVLTNSEGPTLFAGEILEKTSLMIRKASPDYQVAPGGTAVRRAGYLAELGWARLRQGQHDDPNTLSPVYLRTPAGA